MTLARPLTQMELSIIDERKDLSAAEDALRRARGEAPQLTGVCACGQSAAMFYLSECVACQLDRSWRDSSDFALLAYTEPTAMLHAFLWHWLELDSMELRLAFVSFALGRVQMLDNLADITEAERDQIYDLVNGWQAPGGCGVTTLAEVPLAEILWRLADYAPTCLRHSTVDLAMVTGVRHHFHAWPKQEGYHSSFSGREGAMLALALADWGEAQGWDVELIGRGRGVWTAVVTVPDTFGPLEVRRKGDEALLYAVAGALLMALDIEGGGNGLVGEL